MYHHLDQQQARELLSDMPASGLVELLAETFRVLSDPTRVRILYLLSRAELCVHDLAQLLGISQPAASHHLRILRMQGLVRTRREGKSIYYALDDEHVVELFRCGYDHVRHWERPGRPR
ncbi:TPA: transcriptional regulator [Candidatus Bipolaricaulota bacterium]|nr:transcriptional regulator [Candidatus Bipolaricaulota bacterium]